jgi:phosphoribosylamine--glycine ligase
VKRVYCAPGNAGTAAIGDNVDIAADDIAGLVRFASAEKIELTVIGPEGPLCAGVVDAFAKQNLACFGPTKAAAEIEGSKTFARELCRRHRIPGPAYWTFDDYQMARSFLSNREDGPIVVKASGLAAGKGVTVCKTSEEATVAANECLEKRRFGEAGARVVFEEFLEGSEVSLITLTDGRTIVPLEPARDHKAVFDGDKGPNTGGMGVITPVAVMPRMQAQMESQIVVPTVHAMNRENRRYQGFLYAGLMLTTQGPRTLEFNCRLGDPETQPIMLRLKSDLTVLVDHALAGTLGATEAEWDTRVALGVVLASAGYPESPRKGDVVRGLPEPQDDFRVFHAGTTLSGDDVMTNGGRVLAVTALGHNVKTAQRRAYDIVSRIRFEGMQYRGDIGHRAVAGPRK